jgi:hypothetical protein
MSRAGDRAEGDEGGKQGVLDQVLSGLVLEEGGEEWVD